MPAPITTGRAAAARADGIPAAHDVKRDLGQLNYHSRRPAFGFPYFRDDYRWLACAQRGRPSAAPGFRPAGRDEAELHGQSAARPQ